MSVHINEVLNYLEARFVSNQDGDVGSLLEMIHDAYRVHNRMDSEEIRNHLRDLHVILDLLPVDKADAMCSVVCDLCMEHEVLAFSHGILVGMQFMTEVNMLP